MLFLFKKWKIAKPLSLKINNSKLTRKNTISFIIKALAIFIIFDLIQYGFILFDSINESIYEYFLLIAVISAFLVFFWASKVVDSRLDKIVNKN